MSKCLPKKRNALSKAPNPNPPGTMSHVQTEKTHKQFKRMGQQQNIYYATVCIQKNAVHFCNPPDVHPGDLGWLDGLLWYPTLVISPWSAVFILKRHSENTWIYDFKQQLYTVYVDFKFKAHLLPQNMKLRHGFPWLTALLFHYACNLTWQKKIIFCWFWEFGHHRLSKFIAEVSQTWLKQLTHHAWVLRECEVRWERSCIHSFLKGK